MAKFRGKVGYLILSEKIVDQEPTGIWEESYDEKTYYGDVLRTSSRWESSGNLNDDISISNRISIVADPFAYENFQHIKYVIYIGIKWRVETVEVERPRIILSLGGVYNEKPNGSA